MAESDRDDPERGSTGGVEGATGDDPEERQGGPECDDVDGDRDGVVTREATAFVAEAIAATSFYSSSSEVQQ